MSELSGSQLAAGILQDEEENVASPRPGVLPFMQPVVNGNHDATGRELGVVPPVADTAITDILDADEGDLNTKIALNFVNAEMETSDISPEIREKLTTEILQRPGMEFFARNNGEVQAQVQEEFALRLFEQNKKWLDDNPRLKSFFADPVNNKLSQRDLADGRMQRFIRNVELISKKNKATGWWAKNFENFWQEQGILFKEAGRGIIAAGGKLLYVSGQAQMRANEAQLLGTQAMVGKVTGDSSREIEETLNETAIRTQRPWIKSILTEDELTEYDAADGTTVEGQTKQSELYLKALEASKIQVFEDVQEFTDDMWGGRENDKRDLRILKARLPDGGFAYWVRTIEGAVVQMAPTVAAGLLSGGSLAAPSAVTFLQVFGRTYDTASHREGWTHEQALGEATFKAAVEMVSERLLPLRYLFPKKAGGAVADAAQQSAVATFLKVGVAEGAQEMFVEAVDIAYANGILDENIGFEEGVQRLIEAGIIGFAVGGQMKLTVSGVNMVKDKAFGKQSQDYLDTLQAVNEAANNLDLMTTAPTAVQELVDEALADPEADGTVLVDAQKLLDLHQDTVQTQAWQDSVPVDAMSSPVAEALGVNFEEIKATALEGGEVVIKTSKLVTLSPEQFKTLSLDIRESIGSYTVREHEAALVQQADDVAAVTAALQENQAAMESEAAPGAAIYDLVQQQAIDSGVSAIEADTRGQLIQEFYVTQSALLKNPDGSMVSPEQLFAEQNVTLQAPGGPTVSSTDLAPPATEALASVDTDAPSPPEALVLSPDMLVPPPVIAVPDAAAPSADPEINTQISANAVAPDVGTLPEVGTAPALPVTPDPLEAAPTVETAAVAPEAVTEAATEATAVDPAADVAAPVAPVAERPAGELPSINDLTDKIKAGFLEQSAPQPPLTTEQTLELEQSQAVIEGQQGSMSTQIATTATAYPKVVARVESQFLERPVTTILDYGSGLGFGTQLMREEGRDVESYEPNPDRAIAAGNVPTYSDSTKVTKKYDLVMNLNVLNVLEPKLRDVVLADIISKIDDGGAAVIGTRGWTGDIATAKNVDMAVEDKAVWVNKKDKKVYQKGWDGNELLDYITARLPIGYTAVKISGVGKRGVLIRKNAPEDSGVTMMPLNQDTIDVNETVEETQERIVSQVTGRDGKVITVTETQDLQNKLVDSKVVPRIKSLQELLDKTGEITIIPTIADRTAAGTNFYGADGQQYMGIPALGGPFFPLTMQNIAGGFIWADRGAGVEAAKRDKTMKKGVTHMLVTLGTNNMHQSNTTVTQVYVQDLAMKLQSDLRPGTNNPNPITKEKLAEVMQFFENMEFKGNPDSKSYAKTKVVMEEVMSFANVGFDSLSDGTGGAKLNQWLQNLSFDARKIWLDKMGSKEIAGKLGIDMQKILDTTREPTLNTQGLGAGVVLLEIDTASWAKGSQPIQHPDFPSAMMGKVVGVFDTPISWELLWQDHVAAEKAAEIAKTGAPRKGPQEYRAWTLKAPPVTLTQDLVDRIGDHNAPGIDGEMQARMVMSMIDTRATNKHWGDANVGNGGVKPIDYADAVERVRASQEGMAQKPGSLEATQETYTKKDGTEGTRSIKGTGFNAKLKMGREGKVGGLLLSQLGKTQAWSLIEITPRGKKIVSLFNLEQNTQGIAETGLILDALDQGATLSVADPRNPVYNLLIDFGFAPNSYGELEFNGEVQANGETYTERYFRYGFEGIQNGRVDPDVAAITERIVDDSAQPASSEQAVKQYGYDPLAKPFREGTLQSRAREIALTIAKLPDNALRNLKLPLQARASVSRIISNPLPLYQEEAPKIPAKEIEARLTATTLPSDADVLGMLGGFPNYLNAVASFMGTQRQKLVQGKMTPRDVAKAYAITVGSQGAGAMKVSTFLAKTGFQPSPDFVERGMIRPEEAMAMWFGTPNGQAALDAVSKGNTDPALWQELIEWRKAWGDDRLGNMGLLSDKGIALLPDVVANLNELGKRAGRGQSVADDINTELQRLGGIAAAKGPFISHLLGMGETVTMDAVEINFWLTGKADVSRLKAEEKALAQAVAKSAKGKILLRDMVMARLENLRATGQVKVPPGMDPKAYMHVMHHWLWDRAKGIETTHTGLYKGMTMYQPAEVNLLPENKLEKVDKQYGVGKKMGNETYLHKSAMDVLPADVQARIAEAELPPGHEWAIVKYNKKTGQISLIESYDWDTSHEPTVGNSLILKPDGTVKLHKAPVEDANKTIYHHKWLFVRPGYTGFNYVESRLRSRTWQALGNLDSRRYGRKGFWQENVLPRLEPNYLTQTDTGPVGPRGRFFQEKDVYGNVSNIIEMTKNADKSTFLHEAGHFFLFQQKQMLEDSRLTEDGRKQLNADAQTTTEWFRKNADQVWQEMQDMMHSTRKAADADPSNFAKQERADRIEAAVVYANDHGGVMYMRDIADNFMNGKMNYGTELEIGFHELWARGTEKYFSNGEAPTPKLRKLFENYSAWLTKIYRNLSRLNVNIDPEITQVFSRLVAIDDALTDATESATYTVPPELTALASEAETEALNDLATDAQNEAREQVKAKVQKEIKREQAKTRKEAEAKIKERVTAEVQARPVYAAINMLRRGILPDGTKSDKNLKLNYAEFKKRYGLETMRRITAAAPGLFTNKRAKDGTVPEDVASSLGFEGPDQMVAALAAGNYPKQADAIRDETTAAINNELGEILSDEQITEMADEAVNNDKQLDVLAAQARILRRVIAQNARKQTDRKATDYGVTSTARQDIAAAKAAKATETAAVTEDTTQADAADATIGTVTAEQQRQSNVGQRRAQRKASVKLSEILRNVSLPAIKAAAVDHISKLPLNRIHAGKYRTTAERITKKYARALVKRDYVEAEGLLNLIILNTAMSKEAARVQGVISKDVKSLQEFGNRTDKKLATSYDVDVVNVMRAMLHTVGIGKANSKNMAPGQALSVLQDTDQELDENLTAVAAQVADIEVALRNMQQDGNMPTYKDMSVIDIQSLLEIATELKKMARERVQLTVEGREVNIDEVADEIASGTVDLVRERKKKKGVPIANRGTQSQRGRQTFWQSFRSSLLTTELWARFADNNNADGPITSNIVRPVMKAITNYNINRAVPLKKLVDMLRGQASPLNVKINVTASEFTDAEGNPWSFLTKGEIIHALLHTGNASNFRKLLLGGQKADGVSYMFGKENPDGTLDTSKWDAFIMRMVNDGVLTQADFQLVQEIWDLFEQTKGPAQAAHKELYGYYFPEVPAEPVSTPFGVLRGGYVPAITDRSMNTDAAKQAAQDDVSQMRSNTMFPAAERGFTKQRVEYNEPLDLDLAGLPQHLDKVMKFSYINPAVQTASRFLRNKKIRAALSQIEPMVIENTIIPFLSRAVRQETTDPQGSGNLKPFDRAATWLNQAVGMNTMTLNIVNTLQQSTGLVTASLLVSPLKLSHAAVRFRQDGQGLKSYVASRSPFMQVRMQDSVNDMMQGIEETLRATSPLKKLQGKASKYAYITQQIMQNFVDPIVWSAAESQARTNGIYEKVYNANLSRGRDVALAAAEDAVAQYADRVVRDTQSPMGAQDISKFEAGGAIMRLFTKFYRYFNNMYNLNRTEWKLNARRIGWKGKPTRAFYIYMIGFAMPAIIAEGIVMMAKGRFDDDEEELDTLMFDLLFMSQAKMATAMVPVLGLPVTAGLGLLTDQTYDDKMSLSPVISIAEGYGMNFLKSAVARVTGEIDTDEEEVREVKAYLKMLGLVLKLPTNWFAKGVEYQMKTDRGIVAGRDTSDIISGYLFGRDKTENR
jgi:hypothetical protein